MAQASDWLATQAATHRLDGIAGGNVTDIGAKHLQRVLDWDMFPKAVEAHGQLSFDESFVNVPLLSLGGPKRVENLQPRKTIEAIRMMVEFQGLIEH